jgi:hypothetical protein
MSSLVAINRFFKNTQVQRFFLHLQHTRHQHLLDGAGLRELVVDSVKSISDYLAFYVSLK